MRPRAKTCLTLVLLCTCAAGGCRFTLLSNGAWTQPEPAEMVLGVDGREATASRPAPKTIPIEMVFVRAAEHDRDLGEELWQFVDEQVLDDDLRRRLAANGLRAGVVTGTLPPELAARFAPHAAAESSQMPEGPSASPAVSRRLLRLLPGRETEIVAATGLAELVLLEHDGEAVQGGTYREASTHFALKSWPAADGRVRLELTPTVKHGPMQRSWVGEEGVFRLENGQRRHAFDRLRFELTIPADSMLLVGSAGDGASSVGDAFFRDRSTGTPTMRLLAIRPQARSVDPLFAESAVAGGDEDRP
jgi:hypothetical protein